MTDDRGTARRHILVTLGFRWQAAEARWTCGRERLSDEQVDRMRQADFDALVARHRRRTKGEG